MKARCVGEQPIAIAGVNGGLCAIAVTAHQLPYWLGRVKQGPVDEARAVAAKIGEQARVAVLDLRPGRSASAAYRKAMAERANGVYLTPRQPGVAVNLGAAKTVISMGAPGSEGITSKNVSPHRSHAGRNRPA